MKTLCGLSFSKILVLTFSFFYAAIMLSQIIFAANTWYVAPSPAGSGTFGGSCLAPGYNTISGAITAASAGDTINVCAGTYSEQLEITKDITLQGFGSTSIIKSPAGILPIFFTTSANNYPVIFVHDTTNAIIQNVVVDGNGNANVNPRFIGIAFHNAGGSVLFDEIKNIEETPINGDQQGVALYAFVDNAIPRNLIVMNNYIHDYQKNGMALSGTGLNTTVNNNIVTGVGPINFNAQNGIQVGFGASGSVFNNTVSGNEYIVNTTGEDCGSPYPINFNDLVYVYHDCSTGAGILFYDASSIINANGNTVTNNDIGFAFAGTSGPNSNTTNINPKINFNVIFGNRYFGIDASADTNTIDGTNNNYHTCFPIQNANPVADVSPNVIYIPFVSPTNCFGPATPTLQDFTVKKVALICDSGASAPQSQNPPEIGGCVDDNFGASIPEITGTNSTLYDVRFNQYLFEGEQLAELVVAQDTNGAIALNSVANFLVGNTSKVLCMDVTSAGYQIGNLWYGHDVHLLLQTLPPGGFNPLYDKIYSCLWTVTSADMGQQSVATLVGDSVGNTALTTTQSWYLNPAISISVSFDSGTSVQFPTAQAGSTVYSTNTMIIKNTALGGVDLVTYLTGNDMADSSGHGLCPSSNVLNINQMSYRCLVGSLQSETWTPLAHLKENNGCFGSSSTTTSTSSTTTTTEDATITSTTTTATGPSPASPIPTQCDVQDAWSFSNLILPDASNQAFSIIGNGHQAQCWFQLNVPFPCIGTYSAANAVDILVRAL